jgi:preprotein translocase subunit SecE
MNFPQMGFIVLMIKILRKVRYPNKKDEGNGKKCVFTSQKVCMILIVTRAR